MSRLSNNDLPPGGNRTVNRISVQRQGQWVFATIPGENFSKRTKSQRFYLMTERFGLCTANQDNPQKTLVRGNAGDYIATAPNGNLIIVSKKDYNLRFPKDKPDTSVPRLTSTTYSQDKRKQDVLKKTVDPTTNALTETYNDTSGDPSGTPVGILNPSTNSTNTTITSTTRIY